MLGTEDPGKTEEMSYKIWPMILIFMYIYLQSKFCCCILVFNGAEQ